MADNFNVLVKELFDEGLAYSEILQVLRAIHGITMSDRTLRRRLADLNLRRRGVPYDRNQVTNILQHEVQTTGRNLGYRAMLNRLRNSYGIHVPRSVVCDGLRGIDPEGVADRSTRTLRRRQYTNDGPNFLIHVDGYDKLKKYGICIHGAIDGYSKKILWLEAGHSNNNPGYVAWFFTQFINTIKGVPRCVRMDRGTENTLIEDIQESFRQRHTDDVAKRSVLYGSSNHNQPIERWWRDTRRLAVQFYMDYFAGLESEGLLETGNHMDMACLRYCFLHIVSQKLLEIKEEWNAHTRRKSHGNVGGIPNILYKYPHLRDAVDFKTEVDQNDINDVIELTMTPRDRGCNDDETIEFNDIVLNVHGELFVPTSVGDAKEMYILLRAALHT